ncbi:heparinase II/III family protein, partial [bacterium]|nr:heparinase II/III family protein [bacterium]
TIVGDIKYLWEPSRHLDLVALCSAYAQTNDQRYIDGFKRSLISWFEQCPYLMGPHWTSSLELGIRLINWSLCWQLIGGYKSVVFEGEEGQTFREQWLTSIYQHAHFINGHYSRFSSANNHLIGEASGVYLASVTWPYWSELSRWGEKAKSELETESTRQNFFDGVNKEQAVSYQQFVLDFLLLPYLAAKASDESFSPGYIKTIEDMMVYLAAIMDVKGNVPMIGDADDGYAVRLSYQSDFCPYRSLLAVGAVLFDRSDFKFKAGSFDDKALFLLGIEGQKAYASMPVEVPEGLPSQFTGGGYYLLGHHFNGEGEIKMLVDAGELGYGGIAAHGHADALSVYLSVSGKEILIDPGTYAYHTEEKWRNYFRGTSAHNTIRIDGQDQSVIGGNFMWLDKAEAFVEVYEHTSGSGRIVASHNGYLRLHDAVNHRREICFSGADRQILISDEIICQGEHQIEQFWHLSESSLAKLQDNNTLVISNDNVCVNMQLDTSAEVAIYRGDEKLPLGWSSRRFDNKVSSTTVRVSRKVKGSVTLFTAIDISISH